MSACRKVCPNVRLFEDHVAIFVAIRVAIRVAIYAERYLETCDGQQN